MCGIVGVVNLRKEVVDQDDLIKMMSAIKHRGPDDHGLIVKGNVGLGHLRLSILDVSEHGHQPMFSFNKRYVLVFNGEIYNYVELKEKFLDDYPFISGSDSEVILAMYIKFGKTCVEYFNGMWAFAILDTETNEVFISRDHFGIKPLYYYQNREKFYFASEINALKQVCETISVNEEKVFEYLMFNRTDQTCDTFIREINRVEHGHNIFINQGKITFEQWYKLTDRLNVPWSSAEEYRDTLSSAVKMQLRSDVPVGVCLSGGLDSSSLTSIILNDYGLHHLYAFSAVYGEGNHGDESRFVRQYEKELQNLKWVYPTDKSLLEDIEGFLKCHIEPVPSLSIYSQYKVMKDASNYITVGIDGQGADEQLAGYHYFFGSHFKGLLRSMNMIKFFQEIYFYLKYHKSTEGLQYFALYLAPLFVKKILTHQTNKWIGKNFYNDYVNEARLLEQLYSPKGLNDSLVQHFAYKLEHNLKWNDLNSMYHSIELRVPFLDYRIVEKTLASPAEQLIHKGYTKRILRDAMKGTLAEQLRIRTDKVGFENPADQWMENPKIYTLIHDALSSNELINSGFLDITACHKALEAHKKGNKQDARNLWKMFHLSHFINVVKNKDQLSKDFELRNLLVMS